MMSPPTVSRSTIAAHNYGTRVQGAFLGSVGPAFAHGCHDLGKLGVESVKLLSFGSARDEGVSIAGYAPAPYPLNGARRGDVRQRVTGHQDQVRALPGDDMSPVGEAEHSCRFSRGSGQGLRRADAAPDKEFELSVQACLTTVPGFGASVPASRVTPASASRRTLSSARE